MKHSGKIYPALVLAALCLGIGAAAAQQYPSRPIRSESEKWEKAIEVSGAKAE